MNKPIIINASSTRLFADLSYILSNMASIWVTKADTRYPTLAVLDQ
jgi:hypothetical protein